MFSVSRTALESIDMSLQQQSDRRRSSVRRPSIAADKLGGLVRHSFAVRSEVESLGLIHYIITRLSAQFLKLEEISGFASSVVV